MFIVFEGLDGSGKDSQLKRVKTRVELSVKSGNSPYSSYHDKFFFEAEPTQDSDAGRELHHLLSGGIDTLDQNSVLDLYLEDRLIHSRKISRLEKEGVVLASRYDLSTYAYQSLHLDAEEMDTFLEETYRRHRYGSEDGCLIPDLTLFFTLSPEVAMTRIEGRGEKQGYEKLQVLKRVKENYERAIDYLREKDGRRIIILDSLGTEENIAEQVEGILDKIFKQMFKTANT